MYNYLNMRKLIVLLTLTQWVMAQPRENKPLPVFTKEPVKVIDDDITGWSFSKDGQWISDDMRIPVRLISTNEDEYKTRVNELGNDNIEELQLYPILYGSDTLVMLVKLYETGSYKYEHTQKGWEDQTIAYYFIFDHKELRQLRFMTEKAKVFELALKDFGQIADTKPKRVLDAIREKIIIKESTDRFLTFMARKLNDPEVIQFQFASLHDVFTDVEGVLNDFQLRGKSIYGKPLLLDYLYYEVDQKLFIDFFTLPGQIRFERK